MAEEDDGTYGFSLHTLEQYAAYENANYDPEKHLLVFTCKCPMNMNLAEGQPFCCSRNLKTLGMFRQWEDAEVKVVNHLEGQLHGHATDEAKAEVEGTPECIKLTHVRKSDWEKWESDRLARKAQEKERQRQKKQEWREQRQGREDEPESGGPASSGGSASYGAARVPHPPAAPPHGREGRGPYSTTKPKVAAAAAMRGAGADPLAQLQAAANSLPDAAGHGDATIQLINQRNLHHLNQSAKHVLLEHLARIESSQRNSSKLALFMHHAFKEDADTVRDSSFGIFNCVHFWFEEFACMLYGF